MTEADMRAPPERPLDYTAAETVENPSRAAASK